MVHWEIPSCTHGPVHSLGYDWLNHLDMLVHKYKPSVQLKLESVCASYSLSLAYLCVRIDFTGEKVCLNSERSREM